MESFNAILKKEEVNVNTYKTFNEAKLAIFEFIESWYNNVRIHSSLKSMESFNAILKKEEVNVNTYKTFNEAKLAIFEFIESWYNNVRIHSSLNYKTPDEKYNEYIKNIA